MKTMVLVPDRRSAHALGPLLSGWTSERPLIVTFGYETAESLPFGLEIVAYPAEEGSVLAPAFHDALARHFDADVILAPAHAVSSASIPTLAIDLFPDARLDELERAMAASPMGLVEGAVKVGERRSAMLRLGLFVAQWRPSWFEDNHQVRADAGDEIRARLCELASMGKAHSVTLPPDHDLAKYRFRHRDRAAILLLGEGPFEQLGPHELSHSTIVATPNALAWLREQMGIADFVCLTKAPESARTIEALEATRATLVVPRESGLARLAPLARGVVQIDDYAAAGGPTWGWSDDLKQGFFPGPCEAALALQWAGWIGASNPRIIGDVPPGDCQAWLTYLEAALVHLRRRQEISAADTEHMPVSEHSSAPTPGR